MCAKVGAVVLKTRLVCGKVILTIAVGATVMMVRLVTGTGIDLRTTGADLVNTKFFLGIMDPA